MPKKKPVPVRRPSVISHIDTLYQLGVDYQDAIIDGPRLLRWLFISRVALWAAAVIGRRFLRFGAVVIVAAVTAVRLLMPVARLIYHAADYLGLMDVLGLFKLSKIGRRKSLPAVSPSKTLHLTHVSRKTK